jgi:meiotically up-regulated gene 157 (Mug157) protein
VVSWLHIFHVILTEDHQGFRPSDDACLYGFLVPANMFAVVVLRYVEKIAKDIYHNTALQEKAQVLREEIDHGIHTFGVFNHTKFVRFYI